MSSHNDVDEQPRKKQRLTGPEDGAVESAPTAVPEANIATVAISFEDAVKAQLEQEEKAGITAYAAEVSGFSGVVKKRCVETEVLNQ